MAGPTAVNVQLQAPGDNLARTPLFKGPRLSTRWAGHPVVPLGAPLQAPGRAPGPLPSPRGHTRSGWQDSWHGE